MSQRRSWQGHEKMTGAGLDDGGQPSHLRIPHAQGIIDRRRGSWRVMQFGGNAQHRRMAEGSAKCLSNESLGIVRHSLGGILGGVVFEKSVMAFAYRNLQGS